MTGFFRKKFLPFLCLTLCVFAQHTLVSRHLNGAWAPNNDELLLVETSYTTSNPSFPYYSDPTASNSKIYFYVINITQGFSLDNKELIFEYNEPEGASGSLEDSILYYLPSVNRVIGTYLSRPTLFNIPSCQISELRPPRSALKELFGDIFDLIHQDEDAIKRSLAIPSPDASKVGIMLTIPVAVNQFEMDYFNAIAFFDVCDGSYIGGMSLVHHFNNCSSEISLWPAASGPERPYFLWNKESTGVYVMNRKMAYFVSSESPFSSVIVNKVPEYAIPTYGGPVSDNGLQIDLEINGNSAHIQLNQIPWTAFKAVRLIEHGKESYDAVPENDCSLDSHLNSITSTSVSDPASVFPPISSHTSGTCNDVAIPCATITTAGASMTTARFVIIIIIVPFITLIMCEFCFLQLTSSEEELK